MRPDRLYSTLRVLTFALIFLAATAASALATVPAITAFSPASGTIGTVVTITGTGFTGAKTIAFNGAAATTFTVNSATKITVTAPTTVSTGVLAVTTSGGTGKSKTNFTATVGAQLSLAVGPPLSKLTISGAGFHASTAIDVYLDTVDTALAVSNGRGLASAQLQIPASAQPGGHWITLVERGTSLATQKYFTVQTNWPMAGFNEQGRGFNVYENTITTANANQLTDTWITPLSVYSNPTPLAIAGNIIFSSEIEGNVRAFSSTGTLLWHATIGTSLPAVVPAVYAGLAFFGDSAGKVYAFKTTCRADGGVCTPVWTKSVGTQVGGGLTIHAGLLYAPSDDGSIHVLTPATGAAGTPIYAADTTHGAITTPVAFSNDGSFFYASGSYVQYKLANGGYGTASENSTVSPIAILDNAGFFIVHGGNLTAVGYFGWAAMPPGGGCGTAPVIANGIVYAAGCSGLGAYEAGTGNPVWSITVTNGVSGLAMAGGVLYACANDVLTAYNAANGSKIWAGAYCSGEPEIANGTLYRTGGELAAYNLPGGAPDAKTAERPTTRILKPDYRLLRQPYSTADITP